MGWAAKCVGSACAQRDRPAPGWGTTRCPTPGPGGRGGGESRLQAVSLGIVVKEMAVQEGGGGRQGRQKHGSEHSSGGQGAEAKWRAQTEGAGVRTLIHCGSDG